MGTRVEERGTEGPLAFPFPIPPDRVNLEVEMANDLWVRKGQLLRVSKCR